MNARAAVALVASMIAVLIGLKIGFSDVESMTGTNCGSPFASRVDEIATTATYGEFARIAVGGLPDSSYLDEAAMCQDELNSQKVPAILLLTVGSAGVVGSLVFGMHPRAKVRAEERSTAVVDD